MLRHGRQAASARPVGRISSDTAKTATIWTHAALVGVVTLAGLLFTAPAMAQALECHEQGVSEATGPPGEYTYSFSGGLVSYSGQIDWGDGSPPTATTSPGEFPHVYGVGGEYNGTVTGSGSIDTDGDPATPPEPCSDNQTFRIIILPIVTVSDAGSAQEGDAGAGTTSFTVSLNAQSTLEIRVSFATTSGTATAEEDYQPTSGELVFAPGETSKNVSVTIAGDTDFEPDETFSLDLFAPANAMLGGAPGGQATIINDDAQPIITVGAGGSVQEGNVGNTTAGCTVSLSARSAFPISVTLTSTSGTAAAGQDFLSKVETITFAPGETSRNVGTSIHGDTLFEPDETFFLDFSAPVNATLANSRCQVTIVNDDAQPPQQPPPPPQQPPPPPIATGARCQGFPATRLGTLQSDTLVGTSRRDVIVGLAGNDVIRGLGGNDLVCAGLGRDTVHGGNGRDRLLGGNGADSLYGGPGNDRLEGGLGNDLCVGGPGRDTFVSCETRRR